MSRKDVHVFVDGLRFDTDTLLHQHNRTCDAHRDSHGEGTGSSFRSRASDAAKARTTVSQWVIAEECWAAMVHVCADAARAPSAGGGELVH